MSESEGHSRTYRLFVSAFHFDDVCGGCEEGDEPRVCPIHRCMDA
jgi:hypothetical protein